MRGERQNSGAALVIVLAIMTILLAIGLTFYAVSRLEMRTATNVSNTVRVDLLSDAAVAIAIAHLNQDFFNHPEATSTDHAWRTLFNGAWIAGKPAFWRTNLATGNPVPIDEGGVPEIDLNQFPYIDFLDDGPGNPEPLYRSLRTRDWLSIPRAEVDGAGDGLPVIYAEPGTYVLTDSLGTPIAPGAFPHQSFSLTDANRAPFVLPSFARYANIGGELTARYPKHDVDEITDVDNDGDTLRDSIWIPLPGDIFMPDDGVDNDLNGVADNSDPQLGVEAGTFVYWGGDDGLDNNGDGLVDDNDPVERDPLQGWFLTAPLLGLRIPIDLDADGIVGDEDDFLEFPAGSGNLVAADVTLPDAISIVLGNGSTVTLDLDDVDTLDNDYDLLINDHFFYAYMGPGPNTSPLYNNWLPSTAWDPIEQSRFSVPLGLAYSDINIQEYFPGLYANPINGYPDFNGHLRITHSGEPVCELVGRAAILITDESSKVNLNVAGGHTYPDIMAQVAPPIRSLGGVPVFGTSFFTPPSMGIGAFEYDTRILPQIGEVRSFNLWSALTGFPKRSGVVAPYALDIQYPGYARADDNGDALLLAMNQRDDDGDGLVDEGLYLPNVNDPLFPTYRRLLGALEGIDEPGELQRYAATRNLVAEGVVPGPKPAQDQDLEDNDLDGVVNELGELGDQQFQNMRQIPTLTAGVADGTFADFGPLSTVFSTDRSVNYAVTGSGIRGVNRIDYNLATPQQIAANLMSHGDFIPVTKRLEPHPMDATQTTPYIAGGPRYRRNGQLHLIINDFVMGLRQGDVHVSAPSAKPGYDGGFLYYQHSNGDIVPATLGPSTLSLSEGNLFGNQNGRHQLPADRQLQALQAAANVVDYSDSDHKRSTLTTENFNTVSDVAELNRVSPWPLSINKRAVIEEKDFLPLEEIEQQINSTLDAGKSLQAVDDWLMQDVDPATNSYVPLVAGPDNDSTTTTGLLPEQRQISYTVAGNEAIKINELMVRPVRRVEAEMTPLTADNFNPAPYAGMPEFLLAKGQSGAGLWARGGHNVLGDRSYFSTTQAVYGTTSPAGGALIEGNVIQFVFPVSTGLPAGRYHLTFNDLIANALGQLAATVSSQNDFEYTIKYCDYNFATGAVANTVLDDMVTVKAGLGVGHAIDILETAYFDNFWVKPQVDFIANEPGEPFGWVYLDGNAVDPSLINNTPVFPTIGGYFLQGMAPQVPAQHATAPLTHTVMVPPAVTGKALCVGIRISPDHPAIVDGNIATEPLLSVNFFDFSQEPDHEWIEVLNTSAQAVDLSRWQLEVGIPDIDGVVPDRFKRLWEIPEGTTIAPNGTLLLCANKLDTYWAPNGVFQELDYNVFSANGIGLAASASLPEAAPNPFISGITVPDIFSDTSSLVGAVAPDVTGNVFRRDAPANTPVTDYVDRDGDGSSSYAAASVNASNDTDATLVENTQIQSSPPSAAMTFLSNRGSEQPFDRIVELRSIIFTVDQNGTPVNPNDDTLLPMSRMQTVTDIAETVLRGGILPNYPEQDSIDNDGDGAYLLAGGAIVPGILDEDMVDNNLNGFIDEQATALNLVLSEGYDEGAFTLSNHWLANYIAPSAQVDAYPVGPLRARTMPYSIFRDRQTYYADLTVLGLPVTAPYYDSNLPDSDIAVIGTGSVYGVNLPAYYTGFQDLNQPHDPPEWKEFVERRWYPGDNVIVSLYQGSAVAANLVDRVTYSESDVINRTRDDIVASPYLVDGFHSLPDTDLADPADIVSANIHYPSFWLPNQMGLDFYRSLERKDPLYRGDRFGTQNRWQATDGNYDDWADSPSFFYNKLRQTWPPTVLANAGHASGKFVRLASADELRLYGHTMYGSPLRQNLAFRIEDNPNDLAKVLANLPDVHQFLGANELNDGVSTLANLEWTFEKLPIADRDFTTVGELMRLPQLVREHRMVNTPATGATLAARFSYDLGQINTEYVPNGTVLPSVSLRQDLSLRGVALGQDQTDTNADKDLLTAAVDSMATESVVLTVAQANFTPIRPFSDVVGNELDYLDWDAQVTPPGVWAPLYLFTAPIAVGDTAQPYPQYADGSFATSVNPAARMPLNGLLDSAYLLGSDAFNGGLTPAALLNRYSLNQRAMMYVSAYNPAAYDDQPSPRDQETTNGRPQALFEWGPEDGLENGDYVVYVGTYLPGLAERLTSANLALAPLTGNPSLTNGPQAFAKLQRMGTDQLLTLEVITDPTRGRGQQALNANSEEPGLVHPANWNAKTYTPNEDGYILYGDASTGSWRPQLVHVTNNYLAVRVRNDGQQGQIGAITHVVLAPRKRVPGKINLNTVEPHLASAQVNPGTLRYSLFQTLMGLPSVVDAAGLEDADVSIPGLTQPAANQLPRPTDIANAYDPNALVPPTRWLPDFADNFSTVPEAARLQLTSMIALARPEHVDGRYYTSVADITRDKFATPNPEIDPRVPTGDFFYPLSNAALDETRYEQVSGRFQRLANLLSVRSDVYEIITTVQAGYGVDADNDGRFNYRSDEEFTVTAETKARVVYERRSAPDRTDQPAR